MKSIPSIMLSALIAGAMGLALPAQEDDSAKKKGPDPEVAVKLKELGAAVKHKKFALDPKAVELIDALTTDFEALHQKDQRSVLKGIDSVFKGRKRPPEQSQLYRAAVGALGTVGGPDASKILVRLYEKPRFGKKEWLDLQLDMLESVGRTKDEKQVKWLIDLARRSHIAAVQAKAGGALRHFSESDQKIRKGIVSSVIKTYGEVEGKAKALDHGEGTQTEKRRLAAIADPWNQMLAKLTGADFHTAVEWTRWNNKNKNADWK